MVAQNSGDNTQSENAGNEAAVADMHGFQVLADCNQEYLDANGQKQVEVSEGEVDEQPSFHQEITREQNQDQVANSHILSGEEADPAKSENGISSNKSQELQASANQDFAAQENVNNSGQPSKSSGSYSEESSSGDEVPGSNPIEHRSSEEQSQNPVIYANQNSSARSENEQSFHSAVGDQKSELS